tara:strand:+ start:530 stop:1216 length:687 start_codon:yes stop_codon:yes gene_type:complete
MSDIFQEVDEALKQEKAEQWWKENGKMVLWFCFCLVFFTAVITFGRNWMETNRQENTMALLNIVQSVENNKVEELSSFADDSSEGLSMVATFTAASNQFAQDQNDEALATLKAYADDESGLYADYARYLYVSKSLDLGKGNDEELRAFLQPLIEDNDSAWHGAALEILGLMEYEAGNFEKSLELFTNVIQTEGSPATRVVRAQKMRHLSDLKIKSQLEENKGTIIFKD